MKINMGEIRKFLGSLVAVAGSLVTLGVTGTAAHIVAIVSTVAASLMVYWFPNDPPVGMALVSTDPATAVAPSLGVRPKG